MTSSIRVGLGYDSHRFVAGRRLVLGGVEIPYRMGLEGHSDADALSHAVADAVLGACALGDLGEHFPPGDPRWADCSSLSLLADVAAKARAAGYRIVNVDSVLVAQEPRLKQHRQAMREALARTLDIELEAMSVKLKSAEGMGALGRVEGVAAHAVVGVARTTDAD
jgi:2-C-methyl-D-erythritol 2,4-cyclodiphosphate synthase